MTRLAFMGVLQVGETVIRAGRAPLPPGVVYLLTTPRGQVDTIGQDANGITIRNVGHTLASYMIFAVDQLGMTRLAAVRQLVNTFAKPKEPRR